MEFIRLEGDEALVIVDHNDPPYRKALRLLPYAEVDGKICDGCKTAVANGKCGCEVAVD
jgi:hypothetical protein